jgi:dienelactone hydrolase
LIPKLQGLLLLVVAVAMKITVVRGIVDDFPIRGRACPQTPFRFQEPAMRKLLVVLPTMLLMVWHQPGLAADTQGVPDVLPGTEPLTWTDDIASRLVDGVDRFLLTKLEQSIDGRAAHWQRDFSSPEAYTRSIEPNRKRLAHILGVRDDRVPFDGLELAGTTSQPALVGGGKGYDVFAVRWPVFRYLHGEGLLLVPEGQSSRVRIVAVPDADQTPEMICGLTEGVAAPSQYARRLAENGCMVLVPTLISREMKPRNGRAVLTNREYLYRSAFELGRHMIGYEIQKILAGVDWFVKDAGASPVSIGVIGWGEGGLLALYTGALDTRLDAVCVSGYFDSRQNIWQEPIDRNVFGLLDQFGDAEVASMIAPRKLIVEACRGPELELPGKGGAPARLLTPPLADVRAEVLRARKLGRGEIDLVETQDGKGTFGTEETLTKFLDALVAKRDVSQPSAATGVSSALDRQREPEARITDRIVEKQMSAVDARTASASTGEEHHRSDFDPDERQNRQVQEIDDHNQWLLRESAYVRKEFMNKLDTSALDKYGESVQFYREFFRREVVGWFDEQRLPFNARTRRSHDREKWTGYEVVLDVFPDVIAYGILLLPKDLKPGDRRPVVVCQHGLEGRPQQVVDGDHRAYHDFAAKLAERGFITFAPQNLYIFKDRFRTLQRKANPLKKTLFSVIVPQHQQIVDWLSTLPNVDPQRIGFYGLSYGGKSAMRIPPLVENYCLSICSADFNEWVWKNVSTRARYSYVWTGEYEIFEFDLGSTFNYAEMAALIAPRPFMVERGHFDGVSSDEAVAFEFAKVRNLYSARLGIGDRCEIEWFVGPHTINGEGTFRFLHKHLNWPEP